MPHSQCFTTIASHRHFSNITACLSELLRLLSNDAFRLGSIMKWLVTDYALVHPLGYWWLCRGNIKKLSQCWCFLAAPGGDFLKFLSTAYVRVEQELWTSSWAMIGMTMHLGALWYRTGYGRMSPPHALHLTNGGFTTPMYHPRLSLNLNGGT